MKYLFIAFILMCTFNMLFAQNYNVQLKYDARVNLKGRFIASSTTRLAKGTSFKNAKESIVNELGDISDSLFYPKFQIYDSHSLKRR